MTYSVIYHDFRQNTHPASDRENPAVLTADILAKGRRWRKFCAGINKTTETLCLVLCGVSIAVSVTILCQILG